MVFADPDHRVAHRAGHADSGTLGRRRGSSIATAQADSARQLSNEEVALGVGLRLPLGISEGARLRVCDPVTMRHLSDAGEEKPSSDYWLARLRDGDIETAAPAAPAGGEG